jgi:hypothetical protein
MVGFILEEQRPTWWYMDRMLHYRPAKKLLTPSNTVTSRSGSSAVLITCCPLALKNFRS